MTDRDRLEQRDYEIRHLLSSCEAKDSEIARLREELERLTADYFALREELAFVDARLDDEVRK